MAQFLFYVCRLVHTNTSFVWIKNFPDKCWPITFTYVSNLFQVFAFVLVMQFETVSMNTLNFNFPMM